MLETTTTLSMRQALKMTHVTDRLARKMAASGVVPRTDLTLPQLLALRCLSHTECLPTTNTWKHLLREDIANHCQAEWGNLQAADYFLISFASIRTIKDSFNFASDSVTAMLSLHPEAPHLLLPAGNWKVQLLTNVSEVLR